MGQVVIRGSSRPDVVVARAYRRSRPARLRLKTDGRQGLSRRRLAATNRYGSLPGSGALSTTRVDPDEAAELQLNLLRSHAAGVGPPLPDELVRSMLALRARTLAQGYSGVRTEIVSRLIEMLDLDLLPVVPSQGSVGASGDWHVALSLCRGGRAFDSRSSPTLRSLKNEDSRGFGSGPGRTSLLKDRGHAGDGVSGSTAKRLARAPTSLAASGEALLGSDRLPADKRSP